MILFRLTEEQTTKLLDWMNALPVAETGAVGGRFTYMFTPTGIGLVVKVEDGITKQQIDLTDYNDW